MVFKTAIATIYKMTTLKKGSLFISSFLLSGTFTLFFNKQLNKVLEGTDPRNILLPIVLFAIGLLVYIVFLLADFFTGIKTARYLSLMENKGQKVPYIKSYKLYRTLWKLLGVGMLGFLLMLCSLFLEIVQINFMFKTALAFQGTAWIFASGFEFHSIGENHLKRFGVKPKIYKLFDKILSIFEKKIIEKVENQLSSLELDNHEEKDKTE